MTDADHILTQLFRKWKHRKWLSLCLQSLAIGILIAALGHITFDLPMGVTATGISLGLGLVQLYRFQSKGAKMQELAHYLNQKHPELEQSADLLLQEEAALNRLTRLQQQKIKEKLAGLDLELPNPAPVQVLLLIICISLSAAMSLIPFSKKEENRIAEKNQPTLAEQSIKEKSKAIPVLKEAFISINPPDYTRLKTIRQNDFNITAPYFSTITWNLDFSSTPESVELMLGSGEKLILQPDHEGLHFAKKRIEKNDFYTIKWKGLTDEWSVSDYFQIKVLPDKSPEIEVTNLEAYSSFPYEPEREILLQATVRDDYGISDARIVATVSKGEGESVKFRDDTLHFDQGFRRQLKQYQLQKRLKLKEFNMEPGDELYLHFEASDNRQPLVQTTKTFKYIIALEDSSKIAMEMFGGLAVDRMPEYFRSQRQIIIDTEKLIARRKQLKPKTFNEQSNNIGIDQKVLRLRYGKFLGEEYETVIGTGATEEENEHKEEDHDHHEGFEHDHDHSLATEIPVPEHEHETLPEGAEDDEEEIEELEPYAHFHDISEEVTYYDATTSAKLRAALANMWDAELHLRMGRPEKALPYEYRALKLIKQIQQASRIYVERVGFDPPVIKVAEKRLSGDLNDINNPSIKKNTAASENLPAIRKAVSLLENLNAENGDLSVEAKMKLQKAGDELAAFAAEQGGTLLTDLQKLRALIDGEVTEAKRRTYIGDLQKTFWQLLSVETLPQRSQSPSRSRLNNLFLDEIGKL